MGLVKDEDRQVYIQSRLERNAQEALLQQKHKAAHERVRALMDQRWPDLKRQIEGEISKFIRFGGSADKVTLEITEEDYDFHCFGYTAQSHLADLIRAEEPQQKVAVDIVYRGNLYEYKLTVTFDPPLT